VHDSQGGRNSMLSLSRISRTQCLDTARKLLKLGEPHREAGTNVSHYSDYSLKLVYLD